MERQKFSMQRFENPEDLKLFLEKALQESNVFFENLGISDKINEFLGSERVVTIVNEAYEQYIKDISNCCSKAPDGLKELAENLKVKYTEGHSE